MDNDTDKDTIIDAFSHHIISERHDDIWDE